MLASKIDNLEIVKLLLSYGADQKSSVWFEDALSIAISKGNLDMVKILFNDTYNYKEDDPDENIVSNAARHGHVPILQYFLETKGMIPIIYSPPFNESLIELSVRSGNLNAVKYFLSKGLKASNIDLYVSALVGHNHILEYFLSIGLNPNSNYNDRFTPLMIAINNNHFDCVQTLLKAGATFDIPKNLYNRGATIIHSVVNVPKPNIELIKLLIQHGGNINEIHMNGDSLFMTASMRGHIEIMKYLHDQGADIYYQNLDNGYNALHLAALKNQLESVKLLCSYKLDSNIPNKNGSTALILAASEGNYEIIKYLIESCKADPTIQNKFGKSALQWAKKSENKASIKYLQYVKYTRFT